MTSVTKFVVFASVFSLAACSGDSQGPAGASVEVQAIEDVHKSRLTNVQDSQYESRSCAANDSAEKPLPIVVDPKLKPGMRYVHETKEQKQGKSSHVSYEKTILTTEPSRVSYRTRILSMNPAVNGLRVGNSYTITCQPEQKSSFVYETCDIKPKIPVDAEVEAGTEYCWTDGSVEGGFYKDEYKTATYQLPNGALIPVKVEQRRVRGMRRCSKVGSKEKYDGGIRETLQISVSTKAIASPNLETCDHDVRVYEYERETDADGRVLRSLRSEITAADIVR